MNIKHILLITALLITHQAQAGENKYTARVAVVDVQSILEKSLAVQSIRKSIDQISQTIQQEMSAKEIEFKNSEEAITKKRGVLSDYAIEKEISAFQKKVSDAQRSIQEKRAKLEQAHTEAVSKVHENTIMIIDKMSKERGFNIAIPSSQVLYATESLNITEDVIQSLNAQLKSVPVNYK
jgi:Skp family chaperone for outer membrane proteins